MSTKILCFHGNVSYIENDGSGAWIRCEIIIYINVSMTVRRTTFR